MAGKKYKLKKGVDYALKLALDQPSPSQLDKDDLSQLWGDRVIALKGKLPESASFKQNYDKSSNITSITCRFIPENDVNVEILGNAEWTSNKPDKLLTLRRNIDSSDESETVSEAPAQPAAAKQKRANGKRERKSSRRKRSPRDALTTSWYFLVKDALFCKTALKIKEKDQPTYRS
jgi:hypothetical protein